jgi:hypothetical protein
MPRIVIAGGGIAGLEALVALRAHLGPQAEIQLLEANAELVERQRAVVEPFDAGSPRRFDLGRIAADHHSWFSWREACEDVRSAYQLWRGAKPRQRGLAYEAYRAALEREEHTALLHSVWTHRLRAAEC